MLDHVTGDRDHFHDTVIAPYKGELEVWFVAHRNLYVYVMLIVLTAWSVVFPKSRAYRSVFKTLPDPPQGLLPYL